MFTRKMLLGLASPAILFSGSLAHAASSDAAPQCVFEKYSVTSVEPFRTDENVGYGGYSALRGAQLYVPAREGLTAEWLSLSVQQSLADVARAQREPECGPAIPGVHVTVASAGAGFWVQIGATEPKNAKKVLQWAQSIAPAQPNAR